MMMASRCNHYSILLYLLLGSTCCADSGVVGTSSVLHNILTGPPSTTSRRDIQSPLLHREDDDDASQNATPLPQPQSFPPIIDTYENNNNNDDPLPVESQPPLVTKKTGTTIVGLVLGPHLCVLAADTRATAGTLVADRRADKLHRLSDWACAAGAGTSADLEHLTREATFVSRLQARMQQVGNQPHDESNRAYGNVLVLARYLQQRLLEERGGCQANLILGGLDASGVAHLRALHPHGSMDVLNYAALGSGGLAAMSVVESRYPDLVAEREGVDPETVKQRAIQLAADAVRAGIVNDLGSGSQVDVCVITPEEGCQYTRSYLPEEELPEHEKSVIREPTDSSPQGVNGFGTVPFAIRSERQVRPNRDEERSQQLEKWKDILEGI